MNRHQPAEKCGRTQKPTNPLVFVYCRPPMMELIVFRVSGLKNYSVVGTEQINDCEGVAFLSRYNHLDQFLGPTEVCERSH